MFSVVTCNVKQEVIDVKRKAIAVEASASTAKGQSQTKKGQRRQSRNGATKRTAEESGGAPSAEGPTPQDNQAGALGHRYQRDSSKGKDGH